MSLIVPGSSPSQQRSVSAPMGPSVASFTTMHQAPMPPWRNNDEAEQYRDDPKAFLLFRMSLLMPLKVYHNWIITATYYLPKWDYLGNTDFKFERPETVHNNALWEGKVGLVIGKGPMAFLDDEHVAFHGQNVEIGDWIQYDIMEGRQFTLDQVHCRRLKDTQLVMQIPDPRLIY